MYIDRINLNHLRIFEVVYKSRSMTAAALELHLTQSGVSQHIKALEDILGVKLFDRIKQRLIPTASAQVLFQQSARSFSEIEQALVEITGKETEVRGTVQIGIPLEFGHDVILPLLAKMQKQFQGIRVQLQVGLAPRMNDLILRGELDFAIVDEFITDHRVRTERIYNEDLELCVAPELLKKIGASGSHNQKFFEALNYVEYEKGEPLLRNWFQHHLGVRQIKLNVRSYVEDAYCVSQLVLSGVGAGILPGALVQKLRQGNKLHVFKGSGKPMKSGISIAIIQERSMAPAATLALQFLKDNIAKLA